MCFCHVIMMILLRGFYLNKVPASLHGNLDSLAIALNLAPALPSQVLVHISTWEVLIYIILIYNIIYIILDI